MKLGRYTDVRRQSVFASIETPDASTVVLHLSAARASPLAVPAGVLADALLERFGGDSMVDVKARVTGTVTMLLRQGQGHGYHAATIGALAVTPVEPAPIPEPGAFRALLAGAVASVPLTVLRGHPYRNIGTAS